MMRKFQIYTDGGTRGNGRDNAIGAWGWVLIENDIKLREDAGHSPEFITNNQNEIMAVVYALQAIKPSRPLNNTIAFQIHSDSALVVDAINKKWIDNWQKKNWIRKKQEKVANIIHWQMLLSEIKRLNDLKIPITFHKVKGHSGDTWNEYVDALVNWAMDTKSPSLVDTLVD